MDRKIIKPIVMSGLSALAFGAVGTAGTFALFTDNATTAINVQAGKVDINLTPSGLATYSAQANSSGTLIDEFGGKYSSVATAVNGTFTNGGTATYDSTTGVFTLDRITPGDRVTFNATLANSSNVDIKYRLVYNMSGDDLSLAKGLTLKSDISGSMETYEGLKTYRSAWMNLEANTAPEKTSYSFDIELPIDKGNEYQNKTASFSMYAEAVQGNANVSDEATIDLIQEDFQNDEPVDVVSGTPTVLKAENAAGDLSVKATIPANPTDTEFAGENTVVDLVVSEMIVGEDPVEETVTLNFDVSLYVNGVKKSSFNESIAVEIDVGTNLDIKQVKHNDTVLAPTTDYTYDPAEGIIRFSTQSFSPFTVTYERLPYNPQYKFFNSYVSNGHWVHVVKGEDQLKNVLAHIKANRNETAADTFNGGSVKYPLADESTVYLLDEDIDCDGALWAASESATYNTEFIGTFDGCGHTISDINMTTSTSSTIKGCIFSTALKATFKNLILDDCTIDDENTDTCHGLLGAGPSNVYDTTRVDCSLTFDGITINPNCWIKGVKNCGGLFGYARAISNLTIRNCINYANISVKNYTAGGFIGSATGNWVHDNEDHPNRYISIINSQNHGDISGKDSFGAIAGAVGAAQTNHPLYITISGFLNTGDISDDASEYVSPVIANQATNSLETAHFTLSGAINNTGFITKMSSNATSGGFGLFKNNSDDSPILSNGETVTCAQFFANHVIASNVKKFNVTASQVNTAYNANSTLSLDLSQLDSDIWAQATKVKVQTKFSWAIPINYNTGLGGGSFAGQYGVHDDEIEIDNLDVKTYSIARLCFAGHSYPAAKDPSSIYATYDGDEPQGDNPFVYNHQYFGVDSNETRRGYGKTASGAAYYVINNDQIDSGTFKLLAESYTEALYNIEVYHNDTKIAIASIGDFVRGGSSGGLGKMSQIPA